MKSQKHHLKTVEEFEALSVEYQSEYLRLKKVEKTTDPIAQKYFREQVIRFVNQGSLLLSELKRKEMELDEGYSNYKNNDEVLESEDVYLGMIAYFSSQKEAVVRISDIIKNYQKKYAMLDFGGPGSKKNSEPAQMQ